ncbi:hypothetical protein F4W66_24615 (plasmid) [Escherichia coli]|nr:hypothetical protein F4W66_24615 [Escherichia coli]
METDPAISKYRKLQSMKAGLVMAEAGKETAVKSPAQTLLRKQAFGRDQHVVPAERSKLVTHYPDCRNPLPAAGYRSGFI